MGTIVAFALNFEPNNPPFKGWLLCDGSQVPSQYQELKNMLPNGRTPNLCGRTLIGAGTPDTSSLQSDGRSTMNFPPSNPSINKQITQISDSPFHYKISYDYLAGSKSLVNKIYNFDNFCKGSFCYHWHNQWDKSIHDNSIIKQLIQIIIIELDNH